MDTKTKRTVYANVTDISALAGRNRFETVQTALKKNWIRNSPTSAEEAFEKVSMDFINDSKNYGVVGETKTLNVAADKISKKIGFKHAIARTVSTGVAVLGIGGTSFFPVYIISFGNYVIASWYVCAVYAVWFIGNIFRCMGASAPGRGSAPSIGALVANVSDGLNNVSEQISDAVMSLGHSVGKACDIKPSSTEGCISNRNDRVRYIYVSLGYIDPTNPDTEWVIKIGGKYDGVSSVTNEIIEAKTRTNRIYGEVFENERVQCTMYLAISQNAYSSVRLIERFGSESAEHVIKWDQAYYDGLVADLTTNFTILANAMAGDLESIASIATA